MAKQPRLPTIPDRRMAARKLRDLWDVVLQDETESASPTITELVNSALTAIRFCLPTQLLGKLLSPELDALCLQKGAGGRHDWDPRGFAAAVIVPWNGSNQNVLGRSGDPYVSNPLRRPRLDSGLDQMGDREEWEKLCAVLREVEDAGDPDHTGRVFRQVLVAIRNRLSDLTFEYVVPARVSLRQSEKLVSDFLAVRSGGDRGLAIVAALFEAFRDRLGIFTEIRRGVVNAADAATKSAGDLECLGADGRIMLAVEVKERRIDDNDVQIAVAKVRALAVTELLLCTEGITSADQEAVEKTIAGAWASGTNVYHAAIGDLMRGALPLSGADGIRAFVVQVGKQLDRFSTQPKHRKAWKTLLDGL